MEFKDFYKSTESILVLGGLFLTVSFGRFFAYATALAYVLLNLPKAWKFVKNLALKIKNWF